MKNPFTRFDLDVWGILASGACAVHCLAIPIVVTVGASSGLGWLHTPWIEWGFIAVALWFAGRSLWHAYQRVHHRAAPLWIAGFGFALMLSSRFVAGDAEHFLTAAGGMGVVAAHVFNWRLRSRCAGACLPEAL